MDSSDHRSSEHLLFATHELFEEVDSYIVIGWDVDPNICGQEVVDFTLALVLRRELL